MCFDKTGTLTEEDLDLLGFRFTIFKPKELAGNSIANTKEAMPSLGFSDIYRSIEPRLFSNTGSSVLIEIESQQEHLRANEADFPYPLIVCAMAACHSLKVVDGNLIGDPMDVKMFQFTGWQVEEGGSTWGGAGSQTLLKEQRPTPATGDLISMVVRPPGDVDFKAVMKESVGKRPSSSALSSPPHSKLYTELGVVRSFDFVSQLRRMSVVVKRLRYSRDSLVLSSPLESISNTKMDASTPNHQIHGYETLSPGMGSNMGFSAGREFEIFVKGAPEVMRAICLPSSSKLTNDVLHVLI
jgi:cation-transporting ATPase 13A3/4/5